jgi:small subunit ribosomal protein S35
MYVLLLCLCATWLISQHRAQNPKDTFKDIPHDTRHLVAKARKAKLGEHRSGRIFHRPSIRDFPKEWLPEPKERLIVPDMDDTERAAVAE